MLWNNACLSSAVENRNAGKNSGRKEATAITSQITSSLKDYSTVWNTKWPISQAFSVCPVHLSTGGICPTSDKSLWVDGFGQARDVSFTISPGQWGEHPWIWALLSNRDIMILHHAKKFSNRCPRCSLPHYNPRNRAPKKFSWPSGEGHGWSRISHGSDHTEEIY